MILVDTAPLVAIVDPRDALDGGEALGRLRLVFAYARRS
jgi:hypothetical protein